MPCCQYRSECETLREAARAAQGLVQLARESLNFAELILDAAQEIVDVARLTLDAANAALDTARATYQVGADAALTIAQVGINGLVSIREISFDVELSVADGGAFAASIQASFLGQADVTLSVNINLRDITATARNLADQIGNEFSSLF